jgi:hypothetical protein
MLAKGFRKFLRTKKGNHRSKSSKLGQEMEIMNLLNLYFNILYHV